MVYSAKMLYLHRSARRQSSRTRTPHLLVQQFILRATMGLAFFFHSPCTFPLAFQVWIPPLYSLPFNSSRTTCPTTSAWICILSCNPGICISFWLSCSTRACIPSLKCPASLAVFQTRIFWPVLYPRRSSPPYDLYIGEISPLQVPIHPNSIPSGSPTLMTAPSSPFPTPEAILDAHILFQSQSAAVRNHYHLKYVD